MMIDRWLYGTLTAMHNNVTGKLPTISDNDSQCLQCHNDSLEQIHSLSSEIYPNSNEGDEVCPPLPPKIYQCTSELV